MQPLKYPWSYHGSWNSYDCASLRRGFEVYRQVCSSCHSLNGIHYRTLIGVTHTQTQAKALARSIEVRNAEPNEQGEYYERPGELSDRLPAPYANEEAARAANNGGMPPDLSLITKAREHGEDYLFALLTGYNQQAPEGIKVKEGQYYNRYMAGGIIAMPPPLHTEGQTEYEDGTQPTVTQMAKDVTMFLAWCAEPEMDERKRAGLKFGVGAGIMTLLAIHQKRFYWNVLKHR